MSGGIVGPRVPVIDQPATKDVILNASGFTTAIPGVSISEHDPSTYAGDWRFFGFSLGIIVVILGTAGNGLTVWAYKNNRNLQTSFNVLIANLCCIELVFSLVIIPLQLPGFILKISPYPDGICAAVGYFYYCSMGASLHNLVAIAINRYIGIVNTKQYQRMFTGNRLKLWVISIWLISPLVYLPLPIGGTIRWSPMSMRCAMGPTGNYGIRLYNTILNVIYQAGGLLVLIVLYSSIITKVKHVQRKLKIHRKASFKRTKKTSTASDGKAPTPGTTSGEEGIEDYRPSSVISGGFNFRPAKDTKHADVTSDSGHGSDREGLDHLNRHLSDTHSNSQASHMSPSPSPNKQERRTSLWQILFKPKAGKQTGGKDEALGNIFDYTTDEESRRDPTATESHDPLDEPKVQPKQEEIKIVLRDMDGEKKENRRKKSLSAPTLPALEDIIAMSRKNSAAVAQNIPEKVAEANEGSSRETSPMRLNRAYTVGSKYKKHFQRGANGSIRINGSVRGIAPENSKLLSPAAITNRLCKSDKNICSSMPTLAPLAMPAEVPTTQPRFGTIARKIMKEQRSKRYKDRSQRRKQRAKSMRRRHARERQLVYSSLTICIAFALCILPTSILFVAQTIFQFEVIAPVWMVVSSIAWLHAVVNPFIYGYMNHLYRKEYGHIAKDLEKKLTVCLK